jgi:hypothetical protein
MKKAWEYFIIASSWGFDLIVNILSFTLTLLKYGYNDVLTSRLFRICLAVSYFVEQNNYFGWNQKPKSDNELLTDGICVICFLLAAIPWGQSKSAVKVIVNGKEAK